MTIRPTGSGAIIDEDSFDCSEDGSQRNLIKELVIEGNNGNTLDIGKFAFYHNEGLKHVTINGVENIAKSIFRFNRFN